MFQPFYSGDLEGAKSVLEEDPGFIHKKDTSTLDWHVIDRTPLHYAALSGCKELVDLLVKMGADVNAIQLDGVDMLMVEHHYI